MLSFQSGDEASFDQIVHHYQTRVFHFIRSTIRDGGRAEDLSQEVFIRVYRSRQRYQPTAQFKTWLFTIANRLVLNEIRAIRRRRRVFADAGSSEQQAGSDSEVDLFNSVPDQGETPREIAERKELDRMLSALIEELPANQRAAVELQRTQNLSYAEIASILGVSTMAVKSLLVRAREKLKIALERYLSDRGARP